MKQKALDLGFDAVGVCCLDLIERKALQTWLAAGHAGTMRYMHRQARKRDHPSEIVPGASRAIVLLKNYKSSAPRRLPGPRIAEYAQTEDYHRILREDLASLVGFLVELGATPDLTRAFVDAGPVPERELAQRAGLGWIAKNTMLISPGLGSFTFIASVFTDLELDVDDPFEFDRCGTCRLCLDACPTDAFPSERILDANRCISYLTIEYRGPFDPVQRDQVGTWLFGCDECQDVCPWNRSFAKATPDPRFIRRPELREPSLELFLGLTDVAFESRFGDTPLERAGHDGMMRNSKAVQQNLKRRGGGSEN